MPKDPQFLNILATWLHERAAEQPGQFVFLTLTFDRYSKFAYTVPCPNLLAPTRADVLGGLALPLPAIDAEAALRRDLDRFCCFMMRAIFGRRYSRRFALQPVAIGALDEPHYKGASKRSAHARKPSDRFDHAHFVMFLPDNRLGARSVVERFATLASSGALEAMWRKLNPTGEVHVTDVFELSGAVDYAFKSEKLSGLTTDELLLWPASLPERKSV